MSFNSFDLNTDELLVHDVTAFSGTTTINLEPGLWHIAGHMVLTTADLPNVRLNTHSEVHIALDGITVVSDMSDNRRGIYAAAYLNGSTPIHAQFDYGTLVVPTGPDLVLQITVPTGLTAVFQARRVPTAVPFTKSVWRGNPQDAYTYTLCKSDNGALSSPDDMFTGEVPAGAYDVHVRFSSKDSADIEMDFGSVVQTLQAHPDATSTAFHAIEYRNRIIVNPGASYIRKTVSSSADTKDFTLTLTWHGDEL